MRALALAALVTFVIILTCLSLTSIAVTHLNQNDEAVIANMQTSAEAQLLTIIQSDAQHGTLNGGVPVLPTLSFNPCGSGVCAATGSSTCTAGYGTATGTDENVNKTVGEGYVSVECTTQLLVGANVVGSSTFHATYITYNGSPWAAKDTSMNSDLGVHTSTNIVSGEASTFGCNPTVPTTCQTVTDSTLNNSALYTDTRPHVVPTCPPPADPTECTNAGASIPADTWGTATWNTPQQ
jgi:hypothetical protein